MIPEYVQQVSGSFKLRTSVLDWLHARHVAYMTWHAALAVSSWFPLMEALGTTAQEAVEMGIGSFKKPTGGSRPIRFFCGLHRLWAKARRA